MCMVLGLSMSFQSCKDYDDDIDKLNNRIDGVITDLTTLKETVKGLIKEVTYDAATGKLTVTPVNGDSKTYAIGQSLPTYELKVSGASCWLEKDGQQSGDKLEITIPDAPAGFDETKLTVKTENGKYCIYYNEKKTNVEIAADTIVNALGSKKNVFDDSKLTVPFTYVGDCSGERTADIASAIRTGYKAANEI